MASVPWLGFCICPTIARSTLPSPRKSAAAMPTGFGPDGNCHSGWNVPSPLQGAAGRHSATGASARAQQEDRPQRLGRDRPRESVCILHAPRHGTNRNWWPSAVTLQQRYRRAAAAGHANIEAAVNLVQCRCHTGTYHRVEICIDRVSAADRGRGPAYRYIRVMGALKLISFP